jgi:potassium efflux system protein
MKLEAEIRSWFEWLSRDWVTIGSVGVSATDLLFATALVIFAALFSRIFRRSLRRLAERGAEENKPFYYALGRIGHYLIVAVAVFAALQIVGFNLSSLAFAAGAIGIGVGLGLQSVVNNFVSGLILLFERTLKVGDFVELESGLQGTVRSINVRSTVLTTNDNLDVVVPNSEFTNGVLSNWTMSDAGRRIHVPFGVAYGTDKELVRRAALEAAARVDATDISPNRPPQVWLVGFGDSSLNFELVVWVGREALLRPGNTRASYYWELETSFREHGVEIPFPQRDLHLRGGGFP